MRAVRTAAPPGWINQSWSEGTEERKGRGGEGFRGVEVMIRLKRGGTAEDVREGTRFERIA